AIFSQLLRTHRLTARLTQETLGERAGLSPRSVQDLEAGRVQPRRFTAERLAEALRLSDVDRDELLRAAASRPRRRLATTSDDSSNRHGGPGIVPVPATRPIAASAWEPALVAFPPPTPTNIPWPVGRLLGREADLAAV